jgi:hypothetical protein
VKCGILHDMLNVLDLEGRRRCVSEPCHHRAAAAVVTKEDTANGLKRLCSYKSMRMMLPPALCCPPVLLLAHWHARQWQRGPGRRLRPGLEEWPRPPHTVRATIGARRLVLSLLKRLPDLSRCRAACGWHCCWCEAHVDVAAACCAHRALGTGRTWGPATTKPRPSTKFAKCGELGRSAKPRPHPPPPSLTRTQAAAAAEAVVVTAPKRPLGDVTATSHCPVSLGCTSRLGRGGQD